jgi:hypothetical protein
MRQDFPREYRIGGSGRRFMMGVGGFAFLALLAGIAYFLVADDELGNRVAAMALGGFFALLGAPVLASVVRSRVTLYDDAIESRGIFVVRRMARADIAGRRRLPQQYGPPVIQLIAQHSGQRSLKLTQYLETDAAFDSWMAGIPDRDADEARASLDALLDDAEIPGSKTEKLQGLARARRTAGGLATTSLAVGAWVWVYPHPYDLALACAAVFPWIVVGVAARGGRLYRLNPSRNEAGADLSAPLLLPGGALAIRALLDSNVLDWERMLILTLVVTVLCVLAMWLLVRELRAKASSTFLLGVLMAAYAYGGATLANVELDSGKPEVFETPVLGSHTSSGKSTTYYLNLGAWGPRTEAEDVAVSRDYFDAAVGRKTVCVYLFRGALSVRWFEVWDCPAN